MKAGKRVRRGSIAAGAGTRFVRLSRAPQPPYTCASVLPLLAGGVLGISSAGAAVPPAPAPNALPVPSSGARPFVYSGTVAGGQPSVAGSAMTVNQTSRTLGVNWASFNIGSNASVTFNQPDSAARVLNRIHSADPSVIAGRLSANGQVYLVNQNGILFSNGAQVNVGGLVASALSVSDDLLNRGLPSAAAGSLRFDWTGGAAAFNNGFVTVDAGASITTPAGSRVVMLAPRTAENLGLIQGGAGAEAILAAGGTVILTAPADPNLRGLLVETQSFKGRDLLDNAVTLDGVASNRVGGQIEAPVGVVSLAALAVNQEGTVNATRAINLNGSVMLVSGSNTTDRTTINQRGKTAQIDWKSGFNVSAAQTVEFVQPSGGSVAYNFINDPDRGASASGRSIIDGALSANGQLVLVNEKGFDFGSRARVTAGNFIASALGINPEVVARDLFSITNVETKAFSLFASNPSAVSEPDLAAVSASSLSAFREATVNVASGATIGTSENGIAMLAGSKVTQGGIITTPGGQTILAAGANVVMKPPYSQVLRGFSVEVDPLFVVRSFDLNRAEVLSRGADSNAVIQNGTVSAPFGNITVVGNDITQAGVLQSSTSVTRNGSIRLLARDLTGLSFERIVDSTSGQVIAFGAVPGAFSTREQFIVGSQGGRLTLSPGSSTRVELDARDGQTIAVSQTFTPSSIEAIGAGINVQGASGIQPGASVSARSGRVNLLGYDAINQAVAFPVDAPAVPATAAPSTRASVFVGTGAIVDASGVTAAKSVADLFIPVELRGDELAGNPVQRFGPLRGRSAFVDIRDSVAIADLSGYFNRVGQTLDERASAGGDITVRSTGSVVVKPDAVLNVSGGSVNYAGGRITESRVTDARGVTFRLNDAPVALPYSRLINVERNEAAYVEGKSAGRVELAANSVALGGTLRGTTVRGERQRTIGDPAIDRTAVPRGGKLTVRDAGQHFDLAADPAAVTIPQLTFLEGRSSAADALNFGDPAGRRIDLALPMLREGGFARFDLQSDGRIDFAAGLSITLAPGGEFLASGRQVYFGGSVTAPSGSVTLRTRDLSIAGADFPTTASASTLIVDSGATISTKGRWVNDALATRASDLGPRATHGGSITLDSAYDVVARAGSVMDVSGGARVGADTRIQAGSAGSIKITSGRFGLFSALDPQDSSVFLDGTLYGFGLGVGGRFEVNTSKVVLGTPYAVDVRDQTRAQRLAADVRGAAFAPGFLDEGGFYDLRFTARDGLQVTDGARLAPNPLNWITNAADYRIQPGGTDIASFATRVRLSPELRSGPTALTMLTSSIVFGDLRVGEGAQLQVDQQGSIVLDSKRQLAILGSLAAPAGSISAVRSATPSDGVVYSDAQQSQSLFLGAQSRLSVAGSTKLDSSAQRRLAGGVTPDSLRAQGLYRGQVLSGGSVILDAGLGYLVTQPGSLIDVRGAQDTLNVAAGAGGRITYPADVRGSAGGRITLAARDGMFVDGSYLASGAAGAPGGTIALRFGDPRYLENPYGLPEADPRRAIVNAPRVLTLLQSAGTPPTQFPSTISVPDFLSGAVTLDPAAFNGKARIDLASLIGGGLGSWYVQSQDRIAFEGLIDAAVPNQLRLDSPAFSASAATANVRFSSAALQLGNSGPPAVQSLAAAPTTGGASAAFTARDVALNGNFLWNGFATTGFASTGSIHFDAQVSATPNRFGGRLYNGMLSGAGAISFSAAELYPSTFTDFTVDLLSDPAGRITVARAADAVARPVISAAGRLELKAQTVDQNGTMRAPLGEIVFTAPAAEGSVTLGPASVTSVTADQSLPLGQTTLSGRSWIYEANILTGNNLVTQQLAVSAPEKAVRLDAAVTRISAGARIDLSGGGGAFAYEFTPGPGGKTDTLRPSALQEPMAFAILPGWNGGFAPADNQSQLYYNVSNPRSSGTSTIVDAIPSLKPGDQVRLGQNPFGLSAAESHTLLPARFALMPGAFLVTVRPQQDRAAAGALAQPDGSFLVQGIRLAANRDGSFAAYTAQPLTFEVASQSTVLQRSRYNITTATDFFSSVPGTQLPGDAGRLSAIGRSALSFDPVVLGGRASEIAFATGATRAGRGPEVDLAAPRIAVVDTGTAAPDATWTAFDKSVLNRLDASSLLLGGKRTPAIATSEIETIADNVLVRTVGAAVSTDALRASELLLVAAGSAAPGTGIVIERGSILAAANAEAQLRDYTLSGDGAFVRVAGGGQSALQRTGVTRSRGDIRVESGATVAGRALTFDATRENTLAGSLLLHNAFASPSPGGALALSANRINIVGDSTLPAEGLTFTNPTLAALNSLDQLRLTSYSTLDLHGPAALGSNALNELILVSAGIAGHGAAGETASIAGKTVRFQNANPDSVTFIPGASLGSGQLSVAATNVTFGANATAAMRDADQAGFGLRGFSEVAIDATQDLRFEGRGVVAVNNDVEIGVPVTGPAATLLVTAGRVLAAAGSDQSIRASGAGTIRGGSSTAPTTDLGGRLEWRASALQVSGRVDAPAGSITLAATGAPVLDPAARSVTLQGGARVSAEGASVAFADTMATAPAGHIVLRSASGNVSVNAGAALSVNGAAGGDSGRLSLIAPLGSITAAGALRGFSTGTTPAARQGELMVDASSVSADALAAAVREPLSDGTARTHFQQRWDVRAREADLSLSQAVTARDVRFAADSGNVTVSGTIDASGPKGGAIELYARDGVVTLSGQVLARAQDVVANISNAGTRGQGGSVTLGAAGAGAAVVTQAGSLIDVAAASGSAARGGNVIFRAPASAAIALPTDLNIRLAGTITGATDVSAEIVRSYSGTSLGSGSTLGNVLGLTTIRNDLTGLYTAVTVPTLRSHLGFNDTAATAYHIRPGVDIATPIGAAADFTIAADLNMRDLRFQVEPGVLAVRAARDLRVNNTISDGFAAAGLNAATSRDAALDTTGHSWSYRLVAGADLAGANPLVTMTPPTAGATAITDPLGLGGTMEIAANKLVRTGTGDIALAARRDIRVADTAAVYTAGRRETVHPADFVPSTQLTPVPGFVAVFGNLGGDVSLAAGQSISMFGRLNAPPAYQHPNAWLFRAASDGSTFRNTQWWTRIGSFRQGVGALAGGDVSLVAGAEVLNMNVAVPTNGRVPGVAGSAQRVNDAVVLGGGDLTVRAGAAVVGGQFYAESGRLRINAVQDVKPGARQAGFSPESMDTALALGNTDAVVAAGAAVTLGSVFNPLSVMQRYQRSDGTSYSSIPTPYQLRLGTYSTTSSLEVTAVAGDATLRGALSHVGVSDSAHALAPGRVKAASLNSNVRMDADLRLAPQATGQLDLLAGQSISATGTIIQFDLPDGRLSSVATPMLSSIALTNYAQLAPVDRHAAIPLHDADTEASRLIALKGSVKSIASKQLGEFAEPVRIEASGDILNVSIAAQHNRADNVSRLAAGGALRIETAPTSQSAAIRITGPGRLEVTAGTNVDLGNSAGVVTRGNLENPFLPEQGAGISVLAGVAAADFVGLLNQLTSGTGASIDIGFTAQLASFVDQNPTYRSGARETEPAAALAQNKAALLVMPKELREPFLRDQFYQVLRASGREAVAGGGEPSYQKGRDAAAVLFPQATGSGGSIDLFASQIKTEQGGGIDLLAPRGGVTVGIANPSADQQKPASQQGLFTIRGGAVRAFVQDDLLVNQSRVFTLDGGDILIWADRGNIDAGSGAKTVNAAPPPVLVIRHGQIVLDTSGSVSGSGIGSLASRPDTPASDLDLFAPKGAIDAGDAGLRTTGNVFLGAQVILNAANIQAAGTVAGVPLAAPAAAPVAPPTNPATNAQPGEGQAEAAAAANRAARQGILTVEVLGLGEDQKEKEECKEEDKEKCDEKGRRG